MARPLRIEYPDALYHVMNRGNQRATVFHEPADYSLFLSKLAQFAASFRVRVYCYCLMPNHFHLYVRTLEPNLSRFMQSLLTSFTVSWNRGRGTSGHLFQGRYKAQLVEDQAYHAELSRYVHLNPVRTAAQRERPLADKRRHLRAYRWSSYRAYLGFSQCPDFLEVQPVLSQWDGTREEQTSKYRRFVEAGLRQELASPYAAAAEQSLVGGDAFVDRIKREYLFRRASDRREQPGLSHLQQSRSLAEIVDAVATAYGVDADRVLPRKGADREARALAMYCAATYCRHDASLTALAQAFEVSVSGLSQGRDRTAVRLPTDRRLREALAMVEQALGDASV